MTSPHRASSKTHLVLPYESAQGSWYASDGSFLENLFSTDPNGDDPRRQHHQVAVVALGHRDHGAGLRVQKEYVVSRLGQDAREAVKGAVEGFGVAGRGDFGYSVHCFFLIVGVEHWAGSELFQGLASRLV